MWGAGRGAWCVGVAVGGVGVGGHPAGGVVKDILQPEL